MQNKTFKSEQESLVFYEDRYTKGYMEEWDPAKKRKVIQLIRELNLPEKGKALDFGCGNGVLTQVIKTALPLWEVFGCDVSIIAVRNASKRLPKLNFFFHNDDQKLANQFDFILSHHVFEHVFDLAKSWNEVSKYGKPGGTILHILPCGNRNSFEHRHCLMFTNGIDENRGNRFFYEDQGHLRRLTTEEMERFGKNAGYELFASYYANQYYGAINWLSNSGDDFIRQFTNVADVKDERSKHKILKLRRKLQFLSKARYFASQSIKQELRRFSKSLSLNVVSKVFRVLYSRFVNKYYNLMTAVEWRFFRNMRNGSEMFLLFKKTSKEG